MKTMNQNFPYGSIRTHELDPVRTLGRSNPPLEEPGCDKGVEQVDDVTHQSFKEKAPFQITAVAPQDTKETLAGAQNAPVSLDNADDGRVPADTIQPELTRYRRMRGPIELEYALLYTLAGQSSTGFPARHHRLGHAQVMGKRGLLETF